MKSGSLTRTMMIAAAVLVALWTAAVGIDYWRTIRSFEKPVFALCTAGYDDGGSGTYTGIGYAIEIEGNFMPKDEFPGVTRARFSVFGHQVAAAVRD